LWQICHKLKKRPMIFIVPSGSGCRHFQKSAVNENVEVDAALITVDLWWWTIFHHHKRQIIFAIEGTIPQLVENFPQAERETDVFVVHNIASCSGQCGGKFSEWGQTYEVDEISDDYYDIKVANFCSTSEIISVGKAHINSAFRECQSKLLIWSDKIAPSTGKPSGIRTSNGYPLI
jgi:hypothetical protein